MLQTLDTFNKALLWTLAVGFSYVVLTQARARRNKHDLLSTMLHEHLITMPVLSALLLTGMTVAALDFVMLPGVFAAQEPTPPAAAAGRGVLEAYTLPDANVSVVEVQGKVSQRPADGVGEWQIGIFKFSADSQTTIRAAPGQPAIACLVRTDGGNWKATAIGAEAQPLQC